MVLALIGEDAVKLVKIDWVDSATVDGWVSVGFAESFAPSVCETVGWVVKKTPKYITVTASKSDTVNYSQLMTIPRKCVTSITGLAETP